MIQTVTNIINPSKFTGSGAKGPWSKAEVELDNGEKALIFNPVEVGNQVEKVVQGQYTNWRVLRQPNQPKPGVSTVIPSPQLQEIHELLLEMRGLLKRLVGDDDEGV